MLAYNSQANDKNKANGKKKVQVSSLQTQEQDTLLMPSLVPNFSDFSELLDYKSKWISSAPNDVLTAFNQYYSQLQPIDSGTQEYTQDRVEYSLALVEVYVILADYPAAFAELDIINNIDELSIENKIQTLEKKAQVLALQSDFFNSINVLTQAHQLAVTNKLDRQSILTALLISQSYITLDEQEKTHYWHQQVMSLLDQYDDFGLLIEASILLAKQQENISEHLNATKTLVKVIDLVSEQNYDNVETSLRIQLSHNFLQAKQYINAEQELEKSYNLALKSRNQQQQVMSVVNLINTYVEQSKFDDANSLLKGVQRLERFLTTTPDKRSFKLAKAQVLAGFSKYSQALTILNSIDSSDVLDASEKQTLDINLLEKKSKWLALTDQKYRSVDAFQQLLKSKLAEQQNNSSNKLDFVMANYRYDVEKIKQQGLDDKTLNSELLKQNQEYLDTLSNIKVWLFLTFVLFIVVAYFLYKRLQPKQAESQFLDPITGAHNHSYFVKHVNLLMKNNMPFSLVMFDVDNMRKINKKLGHELADRLLTQIVERLEVRLGSNKLLVRLSADQFIVIAKNFSLNQAFALAEILRKELNSNKFHVDNLSIHLSASFGVICHYEDMTIDSMKDDVKKVLDKAKSKGGNITQVVGFC
jgi:diguanylate cyclase (GGDEF)-like protein